VTTEHQPATDDSGPADHTEPGGNGRGPDGPDGPGPEPVDVVPLLEPRDGLPPVVESQEALDRATEALAHGTGPVAVDAERASGYRYGHRAYLVQLRRAGAGTVLIDPILCPDLSGIDAALADTEAVLHAASQDLPCLKDLNYRPQILFDTELAGRLLGFPRVALGTLVETVLGLHLEKGYSAADWSTRPLPVDWLRYAALDVEVLVELRDALADMLAAQGKLDWALEEFAAVLSAPPPAPRPDPWRRTSGIHRVRSRRSLAVVRALWEQRDEIAQELNLSPGRVLPDAAIVEAARSLPTSTGALTKISGFTGRVARRQLPQWLAAIRLARGLPDDALPDTGGTAVASGPPPTHRWAERDPAAAARLAAVRATVSQLAERYTMPTENLIPPDAVRRISWEPPDPPDPEATAAALRSFGARRWQVELTAGPISAAVAGIAAPQPGAEQPGPA
jgi:ribonuclease D